VSWAIWRETQGPSTSLGMTGWEWIDVGLGDGLQRSFVGRPSLCEGLRFLRMTAWGGVAGLGVISASMAADGSVRPTFLVDLALRYFVSFLYNLNGFMEPLRTGIV
jgi:hypothetical protein